VIASDSAPLPAEKSADKFADSFVAASEELAKHIGKSIGFSFGAIKAYEISSNNSGVVSLAAPVVEEVPPEEESAGDKLLNFISNPSSIIDKKEDKPAVTAPPKPKGFKQYTLDLVTADTLGAGTDANVYCVLIGTIGRTGTVLLGEDETNSRFEQGCVDSFTIDVDADIGDVKELILGHDNKGGGSDWKVKEARLADLSNQNVLYFPCDTVIGGFARKCEYSFTPEKQ